jgi:excisionase family DNA binding protein
VEKFYTVAEIAEKLHKSEISISRWMKSGKLKYYEVSNRRRLVSESQLLEFLNQRIVAPPKNKIDSKIIINDSCAGSLTTENGEKLDVKSLRKEISQLCRSN